MNEDTFNMKVCKFLKKVGITSQREREKEIREAMQARSLAARGSFATRDSKHETVAAESPKP